jgi:hypothetical protein
VAWQTHSDSFFAKVQKSVEKMCEKNGELLGTTFTVWLPNMATGNTKITKN